MYKCNGYVNNAGRVVTLPVFYDNLWIENRVGIKRDRIRKICWHKEWEKGGKEDEI